MRKLSSLCLAVVVGGLLTIAADVEAAKKVTVCHRPPDDPHNPQTIAIAEGAVTAHLKHGDQVGACPSGCGENASLCDDGNQCTFDVCLPSGLCDHAPVDCDDGNRCTTDVCDPTAGCLKLPADGAMCDDGNACTTGDSCAQSDCRGTAVPGCCTAEADCDDSDACTLDACIAGACRNQPRDCAVPDKCLAGFCDPATGACRTSSVTCNDGNACTDDLCNSATGCFFCPTEGCCIPAPEVCDFNDNDCDGVIDNGFHNLGTPCSAGLGACFRVGILTCSPSGDGTECSATPGQSSPELCDYFDNDCDGAVDEGFEVGMLCDNHQLGACFRPGVKVCSPEGGTTCNAPMVAPSPEACADGFDNDCDGETDEGCPPAAP